MSATANPRPKDWFSIPGLFIIAYQTGLLVGLPIYLWYNTPGPGLVVASLVLLFCTEIGVGAAYHRFYAHRAFTLNKAVEAVLLFFATLAIQGSVIRWSYDHRLHHSYTDTDDDPYSIKRGFWYAHFLWLFDKSRPIEDKRVQDLIKNRMVAFQHKYYAFLSFGSNVVVWLLFGWLFEDFLGAFVLTWWTRLFFTHHVTWFVNSLAHCWGERTFSKEQSAVDNYILAFLTVGEGYHNYHHAFASDYRNGVRWYHFDPVKWTVWTLSKLGLAKNLRRIDSVRVQKRLLSEDYRLLTERLRSQMQAKRAELEQRVEAVAERIRQKLGEQTALAERIRSLRERRKQLPEAKQKLRELRRELRAIRQRLREDWRTWHSLCDTVLEAPAAA